MIHQNIEQDSMSRARRNRTRKRAVSLPPLPQGLIPTEDTMRRHSYVLERVERNGPKVARNTNGTPLQALVKSGAITPQQREAGEHFEAAREAVFGGSGTNAIAMMMTLGIRIQGGSVEDTLDVKRWAERRIDEVREKCHPLAHSALINVACHHLFIGRQERNPVGYMRLFEALDVCVKVFGVPEYREM